MDEDTKLCLLDKWGKVKTFGVQGNEGSAQVGSHQLGHGFEIELHGVHDKRCVKFEVELQGAKRNHKPRLI